MNKSSKKTALISDDDEFFRMALTRVLTDKLGFDEVVETTSFDEALEYLTKHGGVSLALFDLATPGLDTPLTLRTIRELFQNERVAVVSGSRRRSDILDSLSAGVHGYVPKWLGAAELCRALELVVQGTVYVPASLSEIDPQAANEQPRSVPGGEAHGLPPLTPRQLDVLRLIVEGKSNKEIARELDLGLGTIKVHLAALFRNLDVSSRSAAAVKGTKYFGSTT